MFYCVVDCLCICVCVCLFFSGGRNITVTGSGFDLIQTAVMKVHGDNLTAFEVPVSILFLFPLFIGISLSIFHSARWSSTSKRHHFFALLHSFWCFFPTILCFRDFLLFPLTVATLTIDLPTSHKPMSTAVIHSNSEKHAHTHQHTHLRSSISHYYFFGHISFKHEGLQIAAPLFHPHQNITVFCVQLNQEGLSSARELEGVANSLPASALQCTGRC